jgi:hypothetical protein
MNAFRRYSSLVSRVHRYTFLAGVGAALGATGCTGELTGDGPAVINGGNGVNGGGAAVGGGGGPPIDKPPIATPAGLVVGTTVIHRLSRTEYANTVKDLLGASLTSLDTLPADIGGEGFSKTSVSQASAASTVQAYEAASNEVVEAVFKDPKLKARLVTCDLSTGTPCIRSTLETFLPMAWRRPVEAAEVERLLALADTEAKAGGSAEEQLKLALRAALISAKFLYLIEKDPDPASTAPHKLSGYELANRLSYLIWSSMPDAELTALAAQGKIDDDAALAQQVTRMLADPDKGAAITNVFAAEWVQLHEVPLKRPDPMLFPMVNDALQQSMVQQTTKFFQDLVTNGGAIANLVASDYTFVDAGLAKLYGLKAPQGSGFVKTSLAGTTRIGGLLGQSSILMQFSNQVRSSAVKRGVWLLDNIFCSPIPPPPPSVAEAIMAEEMDPEFLAKVAKQTARERLAEHRAPPQCSVCHDFIDPIGLALENYDAVGQYRTMDVGKVIDASGQLQASDPSTAFTDAFGMTALLAKDNRVASCMAQRLLTFGLTRTLNDSELNYVAGLTSGNSDSVAGVITKVVTSTPFRARSGAGL